MLNNRLLLIITGIAVIVVIIVSIYISKEKRELDPVINAIPMHASLIIETEDFNYLINKISKNENLSQILRDLSLSKDFFNDFQYVDSLINHNKNIKSFLTQKTIIISVHSLGQNEIDFLFATGSHNSKKDEDNLNNLFSELLPSSKRTDISFDGAEIVKQELSNKSDIFYTFFEDYFLISYSEIILQKSIKNINSGASLYTNESFKSLYERASNNNDAKLYLNYEELFKSSSILFNREFSNKNKLLQNFADWTVFDVNIKRKEIKFTGHTILKPEMQYLNLFKDIKPGKSDILKILPEKTSSFLILNIGKGEDFRYKYEEYLANLKELNDFQINLANFHKKFGINENEQNFYKFINGEIALVNEDMNKTGETHNNYFIFKTNDVSDVLSFLKSISENHCKKNNLPKSEYINKYIDEKGEYKIHKIPVNNLPAMHFGALFSNIEASYYTNVDDFIIFGENIGSLKAFIESYKKDKTFKRKSQNYKFIKSLPDESNIFFYTDMFRSKNIIEEILVKEKAESFSKDINLFFSIQGPAIQFISDSYPIYTTCNFSLNSRDQSISETIWEVRLDTLIATKPFIVTNHITREKEIVIQDKANKLYLIDKTGKIIWTRQLDGRIMSEVYQIDFYENNKFQILFNTESRIYCIDRNGNWLEGYPINLKSKATNGISLIDYDKNKTYRIFVATIDKKISLYDKNGNLLDGWVFGKTKSTVKGKIKLFQNNDKDYIVFRDLTKIYILNRRGQTRTEPEVDFPLSKNSEIYFSKTATNRDAHFAVSNPSGAIYFIYENGKVEKKEIESQSKDHSFSYTDINADNIPEYIYTDNERTTVYNGKDDKRMFTYNYNTEIMHDIVFYDFGDNDIRIGAGSRDKIYLIDKRGKLCEGFPLIGSGLFSVTIFDSIDEFSLIVGNKDNYLYKYKIK